MFIPNDSSDAIHFTVIIKVTKEEAFGYRMLRLTEVLDERQLKLSEPKNPSSYMTLEKQ